MSDAVSPHGFTMTRRGYDPAQVEQAVARLTGDRDQAWERLAGLGNRMRALEQHLIDAAAAASAEAEAKPPAFGQLSERAGRIVLMAEEEAGAIRAEVDAWTEALDAQTREAAQRLRANADALAATLRGSADEAHRRTLQASRSTAEAERGAADRDARDIREAAIGYVAEIRSRAGAAAETARVALAGQQVRAEQDAEAVETRIVAWEQQVTVNAERKQSEAARHRKAMQSKGEEIVAEATATAERLIDAARREAERIAAAAERDQAALSERRDGLQAHLDRVRSTLAALTGATDTGPEPHGDTEAETLDVPLPADAFEPEAGAQGAVGPEMTEAGGVDHHGVGTGGTGTGLIGPGDAVADVGGEAAAGRSAVDRRVDRA